MASKQVSTRKPAPNVRTAAALTRDLTAAENAWLTAVKNKDRKTFDSLMTPEAGFLDEGGLMSVAEFKKSFAGEHVDMLKTSRAKVVPIDRHAALIIYTLEQQGSFQGVPFPPKVFATTTWVRRAGAWRAIFHQESKPATG
jgi:hypothetical protein